MTAASTSNYPHGFVNGVTIQGIPLTNTYPGNVYWVGSVSPSASDSNRGTFARPMATIAGAMALTSASNGDIIMVKPGHAETISTASGLAFSTAGVAIVGLGTGSLRPTFTISATAGFAAITGNNTLIHNCLFTTSIDAVTKVLNVAAADVLINSCELRDLSTTQMTDGIVTTAAANRLRILDHIHKGDSSAGTNAGIAIIGGDSIEITVKRAIGCFAVGFIDCRTTATTNLWVHDVGAFRSLNNSADVFLKDTITASTGQVGPNLNLSLNQNAANITEAITGATFRVIDPVYVVNADNEKALLINWTASTDA